MKSQNLSNLEKIGKLKLENFTTNSLSVRLGFVAQRVRVAEQLLKNNNYDEQVYISAYSELYESFRILCEVMLALCGYRVANGPGHHETAIGTLWSTLIEAGDEATELAYARLNRMGKKRDGMEYGGKFDISAIEIEKMLEDVKLIQEKVTEEYLTKVSQS